MFADGVFENYLDGLTAHEIAETDGLEQEAVKQILAFAAARNLKAIA